MRKSRVLLTGAAIATAAVATGSAFTASNDVTGVTNQVAGYGQVTVSGVTVTDIAYSPRGADGTYLNGVAFTVGTSPAISAGSNTATLTLKDGTENPVHAAFPCTIVSGTSITCDTSAANIKFTDFVRTGLTVVH
jgi:hypothetical protein